MNKYIFYSIVIIIILLILYWCIAYNTKEGFYDEVCPDCNRGGWRDENNCYKCVNCGWTVGFDGHGQCVPGNQHGPIYDWNTQDWFYRGKQMWERVNPRHIPQQPIQIKRTPVSFGTNWIPFWKLILKLRNRYSYGDRYGKRVEYAMDPKML